MARRKSPYKRKTTRNKPISKNRKVIRIILSILILIIVIAYLSFKNWERKQNNRLESGSQIAQTSMGAIEYISLGEGPVILYSHMGGSGYDNAYLFEELTKAGFRIISPSRPGYLRTPLVEKSDFIYQADLFAELLQYLNIKEKVFVMGYSSGGPAAIEFALRYPRKTKGLVLHSSISKKFSSVDEMEENSKLLSIMLSNTWQDLLCWGYSMTTNVLPKKVLGEILERGSTFDHSYCKATANELMQDKNTIILLEKFEASTVPLSRRTDGLNNDLKWAEQFEPNLKRLKVPVLVTHSKVDKIIDVAHSEHFKKEVPKAELFVYEGYGHSIFLGDSWNTLIDRTTSFFNNQLKNPVQSVANSILYKYTWVNKQDGALLKFNEDKTFTLDFPSVDSEFIVSGVFKLKENVLTLTFDQIEGYCDEKTAQYRFEIKDQDLNLKAKKDDCRKRKSHLTAGWFLL